MAKKIPYLLDVSRVFVWLSYVPKRLRILVTVSLLLLFVFLWRSFIYKPLCEKNLFYQEQVKRSEKQQAELLRLCNRQERLEKENGSLVKKDGSAEVFFGPNDNIVDAIVTVANNASVACSSIVPITEYASGRTSAGGAISQVGAAGNLEIGLIGTFHNFVLFLKQLKSIPAALIIKKMECSRMRDHQICARLEIEFMRYK